MANPSNPKTMRNSDYRVRPEHRPGWPSGSDSPPAVGETVYCAGGEGTVIALHGKTGDGSRLVQIQLSAAKAPPFFAAASNVLVKPT
jgi:hypothetical protein